MEMVMNNTDLRRIIFSYFRTKAYRECDKCAKVLCWDKDKIVNKHIHWEDFSRCYDCFRYHFLLL